MIKVTRLNGEIFIVNSDLIEMIEANPDTVITLTTSHKLVVKETMDEMLKLIKEYKKEIFGQKWNSPREG